MSQERFRARNEASWEGLEELMEGLERRWVSLRPRPVSSDAVDFPQRYRRLCQQLSLARYRRYGSQVVEPLNDLAVRGHHHLYKPPAEFFPRLGHFIRVAFPRAVRAEWRLVLLSTLLFYGPLLGMIWAVSWSPDLVYRVVDPVTLSGVEEMYDPASGHFLQERASDSDIFMFGFYIRNNIGIAFRTFAGGVFGGIGSALLLLFNGLFIGAIAGHIVNLGYGSTFFPFVIGHGAFELTAIVLAGVAGLRLGLSFLSPGRRGRREALAEAARRTVPILYGFAGMLLIAAFIEAFWSSQHALGSVRYAVGAALWAVVTVYFLASGRGADEPR